MAGLPFAWLTVLVDAEAAAAAGEVVVRERELAAQIRESGSDPVRSVMRTNAGRSLPRAARTGWGNHDTARINGIQDDTPRELVAATVVDCAEHRHRAALTRARLAVCTRFVKYEVLAVYCGLLGDGKSLMNAAMQHSDKTFNRRPPDCPDIESADRSPLRPHPRRQLAALLVVCGPAGMRMVERATGRTVRPVAAPLSWLRLPRNPLEIFGLLRRRSGGRFDVRPGECLREVAFGDLVPSMRAWLVNAAELAARDARDGFLAVRRLRERLDLPRHVHARSTAEVKPIYVDLDSPLLVRQLTRFVAHADHVRFTEMAPGPEKLWLRPGGQVCTSELRFAKFDGRW